MQPLVHAIYTGAALRLQALIKNPDGTAYNLTGCSFLSRVRVTPASESVAAEFAVSLNGAPTLGALYLYLTDDITAALEPINYYFDLRITPPSGENWIAMGGSMLSVRKAVSR